MMPLWSQGDGVWAILDLHNVLLAPGLLEALPHGLGGVLNWPRAEGRVRWRM